MSEAEIIEPKVKAIAPASISLAKDLTLAPKDNSELMRQLKELMAGQAFPATMDTPAKCLAAWNLAASFGTVSPQRAMARMMYINSQLSIWGELPKALAEGTKQLEDFEIFLVDEKYERICVDNKNLSVDAFAAVCKIKRKGRTKNEYFFTLKDANDAGLLNKKGPWQTYRSDMLCWRAQGKALKFEFGDALMGAEIAEHRWGVLPEREVGPVDGPKDPADELNKLFLKDENATIDIQKAPDSQREFAPEGP